MLRAWSGWSSSAWAAPVEAKANAAARMVRWMVIAISWVGRRGSALVVAALARRDEQRMIIDQIGRIDNGHRPHQFEPLRPEPARRARRAAHGAQRHARRCPRRPRAVGHEPQP